MDPSIEYFWGCLRKCVKDMNCDRLENQIMQVMGFGGNRLHVEKKDVEALYCNLVLITIREIDSNDEGYNDFVESMKCSYEAILNEKYREGLDSLKDNNSKSFVIIPILATARNRTLKHMFFAVVTKVKGKYECILVNKGYRPEGVFTYQRCENKSYCDLMNILETDGILTVEGIYEKLCDADSKGVNAKDQKVGNCICKNMEAAINSALCISYPKYKKYGRIPQGVSDKIEVHRMYIDNLKEAVKDIDKFKNIGFESTLEDKWKEYMYNKRFSDRINKLRKRHLDKKIGRDKLLDSLDDNYLRDELERINESEDEYSDPAKDKWIRYIYDKAFEEKMKGVKSEYIANKEEFKDIFLEIFREGNIKERLKYVSAQTLFECYRNFLMFTRDREKKASRALYLIDRRWLDSGLVEDLSSQDLERAVYFIKLLKEYFPAAVRELQLNYSKAYLKKITWTDKNKQSAKDLSMYRKGIMCNPYKIELGEIFESIYENVLNRDRECRGNEYRVVLNKKDRMIYELLTSDYMRSKKSILQSLDDVLIRKKDLIKRSFLYGDEDVNYLNISDVDLGEIKEDIKNIGYNDENNLMDVVSKIDDVDILKCIDFDKINREELFLKTLKDGNFKLTSMLIDFGVDLYKKDIRGNTSLMVACMGGNKDNVLLLLNKGAKLSEKYANGNDVVRFINDYNIEQDIAKILMDRMLSKDDLSEGIGELDNKPLLIYACSKNNINLVELLLEYGVDVNGTDKYGNTALKYICAEPPDVKSIKIVESLIKNGANVDLGNYRDVTALMIACSSGNMEFVKMLLLAGADIKKKNKGKKIALDMAVENDNEEIVKILKENIFRTDIKRLDNELCKKYETVHGHSVEKI